MFINSILNNSRIEFSKDFPKNIKKIIKKTPEIKNIACQKDIFLKFSESPQNHDNMLLQVFKKGINHVTEIPEYALTHNTSDQIYISWSKKIREIELAIKNNNFIENIKQIIK